MPERYFGWFFSAWFDFLGSPDIAGTETQSGGGTEKTQSGAWNVVVFLFAMEPIWAHLRSRSAHLTR